MKIKAGEKPMMLLLAITVVFTSMNIAFAVAAENTSASIAWSCVLVYVFGAIIQSLDI